MNSENEYEINAILNINDDKLLFDISIEGKTVTMELITVAALRSMCYGA